ncbi:lethal(3)malignant brain tumor-like protein 4 isoform X2 [Onthophagus taurus]|nr:lethal(3)malignant brain tumor-like protein 3 isoform X2 [Onthophagus taurus]
MPKVSSNRLPVTATTNTVQPKIAIMPYQVQNTTNYKSKLLNFKLTENDNNTITVLCDQSEKKDENIVKTKDEQNVIANKTNDKSYQLSIVEDSKDVSYTVTIPEESEKHKSTSKDNTNTSSKYSKHGVSILKRNFNLLEKPRNNLIITPVINSITTISDANTKEVKITNTFDAIDNRDLTPAVTNPIKSEGRRRKSQFLCRKEYDDMTTTEPEIKPKIPKLSNNDDDIQLMICEDEDKDNKELMDVVKKDESYEEYDAVKELIWEDGIGTLPGSNLKFQINEFNLLEFLTDEEYKNIILKKDKSKPKTELKKSDIEEIRCLHCGCFGMLSDFVSSNHCSYDCLSATEKEKKDKETKFKRKRKKGPYVKKIDDNQSKEKELSGSDEDTSNDNSQDKFNYPWTCSKKGFSWAKYLMHVGAKGAPVKLFKDPFPYARNSFRPGMKLEGIDPQHPSYFCILTVAEVIGYRMRLHFDGYPDNYDFWTNADSMNIFPAGWCEKYGHTLHPPPRLTEEFNWNNYLKITRSTAAPKQLFSNRVGNAICPNGFRIGMKLEAVDRKNTALVCVATVTDMMDNRILVHFDSWDDIYDYWADPTSPYIHPIGWCDQNGHNLTPPNGWPNPENFTWESYLKETKCVAAPARAFKQKPANGFKRGMRLECVDKRVPQIIRVATVDDVRDHQIRISFDGWPDRYSYWVDDDSMDIHPVGWCHKTGHPLEPPLTPDDVYDFLECPTVGCRGQGHIQGPSYQTHSNQKYCPYADENIDNIEHNLPDRLLSPDRQLEAVVPVSREPRERIKPRVGRPPKQIPKLEPIILKQDSSEEEDKKPIEKKFVRTYSKEVVKEEPPSVIRKEPGELTNGFVSIEEQQTWERHSRYLTNYTKTDTDPREWTENEVVDFVTSLPNCREHGDIFGKHNIDGESLLMLTQQDIVDILHIKLGPAIKIYNSILLLRQNARCYT